MKTLLITLIASILTTSAFAQRTPVCTIQTHTNGGGYTAVMQNGVPLTNYNADVEDTLESLVQLKESGICRNVGFRCAVQYHSNGGGYSAVFGNGSQLTAYNAEINKTTQKFVELKRQGICQ